MGRTGPESRHSSSPVRSGSRTVRITSMGRRTAAVTVQSWMTRAVSAGSAIANPAATAGAASHQPNPHSNAFEAAQQQAWRSGCHDALSDTDADGVHFAPSASSLERRPRPDRRPRKAQECAAGPRASNRTFRQQDRFVTDSFGFVQQMGAQEHRTLGPQLTQQRTNHRRRSGSIPVEGSSRINTSGLMPMPPQGPPIVASLC